MRFLGGTISSKRLKSGTFGEKDRNPGFGLYF
jgi:hypothetical protein